MDAASLEQAVREVGPLRRARVAGPGVHGLSGESGERHPFQPGQRVVLGQDDRHGLVAHRLVAEPRPQRRGQPREPAEGGVEAARDQFTGGVGQSALVTRHQLLLGRERPGPLQDQAAGGQARGVEVDQQRAGLPEGGQQVVLGLEDPAGVRQQPLAVGRRRHLPGGADEQLGAQFPLQARTSLLSACWAT